MIKPHYLAAFYVICVTLTNVFCFNGFYENANAVSYNGLQDILNSFCEYGYDIYYFHKTTSAIFNTVINETFCTYHSVVITNYNRKFKVDSNKKYRFIFVDIPSEFV